MLNNKLQQFYATFRFQFPKRLFSGSPFFSWVLFSSFVATSVCTGMIITFKLVGSLLIRDVYVDPLAAYDSILPGMPMSALAQFPCHYRTSGVNQQLVPARLSCTMFFQDAQFDTIQVEVSGGSITAVNFYATDLQVGQIALHWQPTHPMQFTKGMTKWESGAYTIIVSGDRSQDENHPSVVQITANVK